MLGQFSNGFITSETTAPLECMAVREALALADNLYEKRIQVFSDCKVVAEDIRDRNAIVDGAIIHEIIAHKYTFLTCNISCRILGSS